MRNNPLQDFIAAFIVMVLVVGPLFSCISIDPLFIFGYFITVPIGYVIMKYTPNK